MRLEDDITCRELVELVTEYLEGASYAGGRGALGGAPRDL